MKYLIEKLTSYNIFNYLFPGVLFAIIGTHATTYKLLINNNFAGFFVYYFYGLVISRIGSLLIEPLLKKTNFIHIGTYEDFIEATKTDEKIEILSEVNNVYRTLISFLICLLGAKICGHLDSDYLFFATYFPYAAGILLFLLFLFAYKKQSKSITKRIKQSLKENYSNKTKEV